MTVKPVFQQKNGTNFKKVANNVLISISKGFSSVRHKEWLPVMSLSHIDTSKPLSEAIRYMFSYKCSREGFVTCLFIRQVSPFTFYRMRPQG